MTPIPRLVVVLDRAGCLRAPVEVAASAIAGGADIVQIRERTMTDDALRDEIELIVAAIGSDRIAINGRPELAAEYGTHLHLPEISPAPLGWNRDRLCSRSIHLGFDLDVIDDSIDYLILGNIRETGSKPGLAGIGYEPIGDVARSTGKPVLTIGGMEPGTAAPSLEAGAYGVAVRSFVIGADDPEAAARAVRTEIDACLKQAIRI